MNDTPAAPLFVSVVYLRMSGFDRLPVIEQARARIELDSTVKAALIAVDRADRVILDTVDGFAILILSGAAPALALAQRCLAASDFPLCIGVNHGVVATALENQQVSGFVGDGLRSAGIAAQTAAVSQMLVTRDFRDALCARTPARAAEFTAAGVYSDATMRSHELFGVDAAGRRRRRQRLLGAATICAAGLIAGGIALRRPVQQQVAPAPSPHATLAFEIAPGGEVIIDGQTHGNTPPLDHLDLAVGTHSIEIRHPPNPPLKRSVELVADDHITIQYDFGKNRPPNLFHRLKHKLGLDQ